LIDISSLNVPEEIRGSLTGLSDKIEIESHSSKGANGHLFFGRNTIMDRKVAIKYYYWAGDSKFHVEPKALASITSPNVVDILDADVVGNEYALFVTPYYSRGDLDDLIESAPISLHSAVELTMGLLNGVSCLHAERLVHRDLKPANVLLNDAKAPLIGDFGSVKKLSERDDSVPGSAHPGAPPGLRV
jgi:serine/threonine protein kinase